MAGIIRAHSFLRSGIVQSFLKIKLIEWCNTELLLITVLAVKETHLLGGEFSKNSNNYTILSM